MSYFRQWSGCLLLLSLLTALGAPVRGQAPDVAPPAPTPAPSIESPAPAVINPAVAPIRLPASSLQFPIFEGKPEVGIICDNLPGMPDSMRDCLRIGLPPEEAGWTWTAAATNPDGSMTDQDGHNNAGSAEVRNGALYYYPPDEFNLRQAPQKLEDIISQEQRDVTLAVSGVGPDGSRVVIEPRTVVLERPTVVMVHGINSSPLLWEGKTHRGLGPYLRNSYHFDATALDFGKNDLADSRPNGKGALYFKGNGPVELLAGDLRDCVENALLKRRRAGFATLRVDIVAHSYGGLVTRWYLATGERNPQLPQSRNWYVFAGVAGRPESGTPGFSKLYWLPASFAEGPLPANPTDYSQTPDIRKVITLASPWRGVPLSNLVNETRAPADGSPALGAARVFIIVRISRLIQFLESNPVAPLPTRVPSCEVAAVNSPWLKLLNKTPFHENVAYGAIAGDDNAYVATLDPYTVLATTLNSGWFPYLRLELRRHQHVNYSDGLMPIWTAVFPGREQVVGAAHDSIVDNPDARKYILLSLSSAQLPLGQELNPEWNKPIQLNVGNRTLKTWTFQPGAMAPIPEDDIYQERGGLARINPEAIHEIRPPTISDLTPTAVIIHWHTALATQGVAKVYQWTPYAAFDHGFQKLLASVADGSGLTRDHIVTVTGLKPHTRYSFQVFSTVANSGEAIELQSEKQMFTTRPQGE